MDRTSQRFVFLLCVVFPVKASAADYYVAPPPVGSDVNAGTMASPWATIEHAVNASGPGDTVFLRAGTWNEDFEFRGDKGHGGSNGNWWTLKAYQGEVAILQASLKIYMASYVRIVGLRFEGAGLNLNKWTTGGFGRPHHIEIRGNHFVGSQLRYGFITLHGDDLLVEGNHIECTGGGDTLDHGIYVNFGTNKVIRNNEIDNVSGYGVHVYDERKSAADPQTFIQKVVVDGNRITNARLRAGIVISRGGDTEIDDVLVINNVITNNAWAGVIVNKVARKIRIHNNTIKDNGRAAIDIGDGPDDVEIKNNILVGSDHLQSSGTNVVVDTNIYWPGPAKISGVSDPNARSADPLFASDGYHLQTGSPAIDVGLSLAAVKIDLDGEPRPMDGNDDGTALYDIGADEFSGSVPPPPDGGTTGDSGSSALTDGSTTTDGGPNSVPDADADADAGAETKNVQDSDQQDDGCSCATGTLQSACWPLGLLALLWLRRERQG